MRYLFIILIFLSLNAYPVQITGVTHYWKGDNAATDEVAGLTLTLDLGATYTTGKINNAFDLDGINDRLSYSSSFSAGLSEFTMNFWIYPMEDNDLNTIIEEQYSGYFQFVLTQGVWYTRGTSVGWNGTRNNDIAMPTLDLEQWNMITLKYSVSGSIKAIYKNSVLYSSSSTGVSALTTERDNLYLWIGNSSQGNEPYNGGMDEIAVFNRALTDAEITALYNVGNALPYPLIYGGGGTEPSNVTSFGFLDNFSFTSGFSFQGIETEEFAYTIDTSYFWDFENSSIGSYNPYPDFPDTVGWLGYSGRSEDLLITSNIAENSSKVLEIQFEPGDQKMTGGFQWWERIDSSTEYYLSFDVYGTTAFFSSVKGKLLGLRHNPQLNGTDDEIPVNDSVIGYLGFLNYIMWNGQKYHHYPYYYDNYLYKCRPPEWWGASFVWDEDWSDDTYDECHHYSQVQQEFISSTSVNTSNADWQNVIFRMSLNSIISEGNPRADGLLEVWVNGVFVAQYSHILWRKSASMKIDRFVMQCFTNDIVTMYASVYYDNICLFKMHPGQAGIPYYNQLSSPSRTMPSRY